MLVEYPLLDVDRAHGVLTEISRGQLWVSEVILQPKITFDPRYDVGADVIARIHEPAHKDCFIAHSVKAKITIRKH